MLDGVTEEKRTDDSMCHDDTLFNQGVYHESQSTSLSVITWETDLQCESRRFDVSMVKSADYVFDVRSLLGAPGGPSQRTL